MIDNGQLTGPGTIRFERLLPASIERVWEFLIDSEKRSRWLAAGPMETFVGGKVQLQFQHADLSAEKTPPEKYQKWCDGGGFVGMITCYEPPHKLSYTWGGEAEESEVTFELIPVDPRQTRLLLTHTRLDSDSGLISVASGWHTHLDLLGNQLRDETPILFWSTIMQREADYAQQFATKTISSDEPFASLE